MIFVLSIRSEGQEWVFPWRHGLTHNGGSNASVINIIDSVSVSVSVSFQFSFQPRVASTSIKYL